MRRTKIVCTLGPAVDAPETLSQLIASGMDVARFNFSHGTHEEHAARFAAVRAAASAAGRSVAILQDLCGPKIRIGDVVAGTILKAGSPLSLTMERVVGDSSRVSLPIPALFNALSVADRLLLDDGLIELVVTGRSGGEIQTVVVSGGALGSKKGIAAPGVAVDIEAVTDKDEIDVRFGLSLGVDYVALSFVRSAADVLRLRSIMEAVGNVVPILVKIEKAEAVANLSEILDVADGAMVARGDLGVEMPIEEVPRVQKQVIMACNRRGKPVITATQMLDSMIRNPRPTRAEVTDIANAILDGTDALMLSGETAIGAYPLESVKMMAKIAVATETGIDYERILVEKHRLHGTESITDAVAEAVSTIAYDQKASAILCATATGGTARMVAKFRPCTPIIALTDSESTYRRLALVWGVLPRIAPPPADIDGLLRQTIDGARESGVVKDGDLVVLTSGTPLGVPGTTNLIKVHIVGQAL